MSRRKGRRRSSWRLGCDADMIALLATSLVDRHGDYLDRGFRLMGSSGVWRKKDGTFSARFVYRLRDRTAGDSTITHALSIAALARRIDAEGVAAMGGGV